jgi:hypothetical protein
MSNLTQGQPVPQTREEFLQQGRRRRAEEAIETLRAIEAAVRNDCDAIAMTRPESSFDHQAHEDWVIQRTANAVRIYAGMLVGDA